MARNKNLFRMTISLFCFFLIPAVAHAVPVGVFSWDESIFGEQVFTVENCSPATTISFPPSPCTESSPSVSFFDVFVELTIDGESSPPMQLFDSTGAGYLDPDEVAQSIEDLTGLDFSSNIHAVVSLRFSPSDQHDVTLPGTMRLVGADGNPLAFLGAPGSTAQIDYYEPSGGQVPVPEPDTLMLLGIGLIGLTLLGCRRSIYCKVRKRT